MDIYRKFTAALESLGVRGGVIVAFSGGADSTCLLSLFLAAASRGSFPYPLAAAHLNHGLRGEEAARDADFCKDFCRAHGIPFFYEAADIAALAKETHRGIEETARSARYAFFDRLLAEHTAYTCVATAHNRNDLCETMLFHLARGTGLDGLCSIPARRGSIVRPLLDVSRAEILAHLAAAGQTFVTDSTNASAAYSRNRIRREVLPALTAVAPQAAESMARTAKLLRADADFLDAEARRVYPAVVADGALDTEKAQNIHRALLSRVLRILYNESCGTVPGCAHIDALCDRIHAGGKDFRLSLPGVTAVASRGLLRFSASVGAAEPFSLPLPPDTPTALPWGEELLLTRGAPPPGFPEKPAAVLAAATFDGRDITVRSRADGDTIVYFGKTHKVKRVIADAKLTPAAKARLFCLAAGDTVLYIRALATADAAFRRHGDALHLYIKSEESKGDADGV